MKICPNCQTGNGDGALRCKDCGASLVKVKAQSGEEIVRKELELQERRERRQKNALWIAFGSAGALYLAGFVWAAIAGGITFPMVLLAVFLPVMAYVSLFHPVALFRFEHMFTIRDVETAEPSDWYIFTSRLSGFLILGMGIFVFVAAALAQRSY